MSSNKLKVCEYFDNLISDLDLAVQTVIKYNYHDRNLVDGLNKQRDEFIKEIRELEAYNLRSISDMNLKQGEVLSDEDHFTKFCFFIKFVRLEEKQMYFYEDLVNEEIGLRLIHS
jgi:hypothetical protein